MEAGGLQNAHGAAHEGGEIAPDLARDRAGVDAHGANTARAEGHGEQ